MELVEKVRLDTGKQRDLYVQLLQHTSAEWTKSKEERQMEKREAREGRKERRRDERTTQERRRRGRDGQKDRAALLISVFSS
jgi:hypothetical protein